MIAQGQRLTTRFILLSTEARSLRGSRAEFLHFGFPLTRHAEAIDALADLAHDPYTALIVAAEPELELVPRVLQVACGIPDRSVYLATRASTQEHVINAAVRSGVQGFLTLPLTPHGLHDALAISPPPAPGEREIQFHDLIVHLDEQRVSWKEKSLILPVGEFKLLSYIAQAYPETITLDTLISVYGATPDKRKSSVRTAIARLRRRLRSLDPGADFIRTVQFAGYSLSA